MYVKYMNYKNPSSKGEKQRLRRQRVRRTIKELKIYLHKIVPKDIYNLIKKFYESIVSEDIIKWLKRIYVYRKRYYSRNNDYTKKARCCYNIQYQPKYNVNKVKNITKERCCNIFPIGIGINCETDIDILYCHKCKLKKCVMISDLL